MSTYAASAAAIPWRKPGMASGIVLADVMDAPISIMLPKREISGDN
jgi:hypothetical protein